MLLHEGACRLLHHGGHQASRRQVDDDAAPRHHAVGMPYHGATLVAHRVRRASAGGRAAHPDPDDADDAHVMDRELALEAHRPDESSNEAAHGHDVVQVVVLLDADG